MLYPIDTYQWFLYLGILFFILHLCIYGISINISYFGLLLISIGYFKPTISPLIKNILWFFIVLDILANFRKVWEIIVRRYSNKVKSKPSDDDKTKS